MQEYREYLLEKAIQCLVGASKTKHRANKQHNQPASQQITETSENGDLSGNDENGTTNDPQNPSANFVTGTQISDVLIFTQLLMDSMAVEKAVKFDDQTYLVNDSGDDRQDRLAHWWCCMLSMAAYW